MSKRGSTIGPIRRLLYRWLGHTHDHFACYFPARAGLLVPFLLRILFTRISTENYDRDLVESLEKKGVVIYAIKYRSIFEFLFLRTRLRKLKLPVPQVLFDFWVLLWQPVSRVFKIALSRLDHSLRFKRKKSPYEEDYYQQELFSGKAGFMPLVDEKSFYRRFVKARTDPMKYLVRLQRSTDKPIYIVPQVLFSGLRPDKARRTVSSSVFGREEKPGLIRRIGSLLGFPQSALLEVAEPINIAEFLKRPEFTGRTLDYLSYSLRREAIDKINHHRKAVKGPALKSRQELKEMVLRSERFRSFLKTYAAEQGKSSQDFHKEADAYLEEIAAGYSSEMIGFLGMAVEWISTNMFDGVDVDMAGLKKLKATSTKGPVILVPCHKSHIDYLILSYVLHINNMPCPLIAAGKNLSFWPMGPIFRNSGAFFIRRTFKGQALYSKVFSEYMRALLSEGFNIEFFIEGGRSRTGKLVLPKYGLLSILLDAYRQGACKDLYFAPIFIGYDRVIEEGSYLHEIEGGEKKSESLGQMLKARKFLKKRFGRIFVRFHDPIRLDDVLKGFDAPFDKMGESEVGVVCRNLGHRIITDINEVSVVTPHSLVAAAALVGLKATYTERKLFRAIDFFLTHLKNTDAELSDTLVDPHGAASQVLETFVSDKNIIRQGRGLPEGDSEEARYSTVASRRPMLEYYKNNCIPFFVPHAFVSMAILAQEAFQFNSSELHSHYVFLADLFKNEFHYDPDLAPEYHIRKTLKSFIDDAMLMPHPSLPQTYNVTALGFKKIRIFARFLKTYLESYSTVLQVFESEDAQELSKKDRTKKFRNHGNRLLKNGEITCSESVSRANYENAAQYFLSRGVQTKEDTEEISLYSEVISNYLSLLE